MEPEIVRVGRDLRYAGAIVDFYQDKMQMPSGHVATWDYVAHRNGAACVLPVLPNGHILMVRQQRPSIERITLEIPAGAKDNPQEPSEACARRELEEETGYASDNLSFLLRIATTPAFCNEMLDIYLATDLRPSAQRLDEDEYLSVEEWEIEKLVDMVYTGEIVDSKTVAAILAYYAKIIKL